MKNILTVKEKKNYQIIATFNGVAEDLSDLIVGLYYRTLYPTKSNKFILIEMTLSNINEIVETLSSKKDKETKIIELYNDSTCILSDKVQFITSNSVSTYSIEFEFANTILNIFDEVVYKLQSVDTEYVYSCRHKYLDRSALVQKSDDCECEICKQAFNIDRSEVEVQDASKVLVDAIQTIKAIDIDLSNKDCIKLGKLIYDINNICDLYHKAKNILLNVEE